MQYLSLPKEMKSPDRTLLHYYLPFPYIEKITCHINSEHHQWAE